MDVHRAADMEIRFISSLTPEDEARIAPVLVDLIGALLETLPVAYTLRVETANGSIVQRTHPRTHNNPP